MGQHVTYISQAIGFTESHIGPPHLTRHVIGLFRCRLMMSLAPAYPRFAGDWKGKRGGDIYACRRGRRLRRLMEHCTGSVVNSNSDRVLQGIARGLLSRGRLVLVSLLAAASAVLTTPGSLPCSNPNPLKILSKYGVGSCLRESGHQHLHFRNG